MSSAYELQRLANIERNHAELKRLGLLSPSLASALGAVAVATPRRRRSAGAAGGPKKKRQQVALGGSRRSLRLGGSEGAAAAAQSAAPAPRPVPVYTPEVAEHGDAEWAEALFSRAAENARRSSSSGGGWERRRAHQHLTLSPCARVIATTGCAGYGAALAKDPTAAQQPKALRWEVEVLSVGTGGFAVGVAQRGLPSPYKSLGNNPGAWVVHSDGRTLHNRATLRDDEAGSRFEDGDRVTILLAAASKGTGGSRRLSFERHGRAIGAACLLPAAGGYTLAVQPYMGGAARLL